MSRLILLSCRYDSTMMILTRCTHATEKSVEIRFVNDHCYEWMIREIKRARVRERENGRENEREKEREKIGTKVFIIRKNLIKINVLHRVTNNVLFILSTFYLGSFFFCFL